MLKIRELRIEKGVSQKELAEYLGMSAGNLCDWEKGRTEPDINALIRIADYFDESVDYLIGRGWEGGGETLSAPKRRLIGKIRKMDDSTAELLLKTIDAFSYNG